MSKHKIFPGYPLNSEVTELAIELELSGPECAVLRHICASMSRTNPKCWKSHETLARETRFSRRTVLRVTKLLTDKKILMTGKCRSKNGNHHNIYKANHGAKGWRWDEIKCAAQSQGRSDSVAVLKSASLRRKSDNQTLSGDCRNVKSDLLTHESTLESAQENRPIKSSSSAEEDVNRLSKNSFSDRQKEKDSFNIKDLNNGFSTEEMGYISQKIQPSPILTEIFGPVPPKIQDLTIFTDIPADLLEIVKPFKKRNDLDTPLDAYNERRLDEYIKKVIKVNWSENAERPPGAPFIRLLKRFGRSKAASWYGFKQMSVEEAIAERERLLKQKEKMSRESNAIWGHKEDSKEFERTAAINSTVANKLLEYPEILSYLDLIKGIILTQNILKSKNYSEQTLNKIVKTLEDVLREQKIKSWNKLREYCVKKIEENHFVKNYDQCTF